MENTVYPSALKRLETATFEFCPNLKRLTILNGVECIGKNCFWRSGITKLTLPATLKEIGEYAFGGC